MGYDLSGRVVAITGASSGIGEATALLCAKAGASVALGARRTDRIDALAAQIEEGGGAARRDHRRRHRRGAGDAASCARPTSGSAGSTC